MSFDWRDPGPVAGLLSKDPSDFCFFLDVVVVVNNVGVARLRGFDSLPSVAVDEVPLLLLVLLLLFAVASFSFFLRGFFGAPFVVGAESLASLIVVAEDDFTPPTLLAILGLCECEIAFVGASVGGGDALVVGESGDFGGGEESSGEEL